jgi:predicted acyltransferase
LYSVAVKDRLVSVDVFRGLTMAGMVIVNNPGTWDAIYPPLEHAEWHGWTPTDLIFPFFLFIVGIAMTLSRHTVSAPWWRIVRRAAIIAGLGLFMAGFPFFNPHHWRIPGVLQRIGLCYLVAAWVDRRVERNPATAAGALVAVIAAILIGYWGVLSAFGDLTPEGNIGAAIDRALMGGHLYRSAWDPEGLLSSVPAVATTLLGVLAGLWLRSDRTVSRKAAGLALAGAALAIAGQAWHPFFPINKQLWTSSYVLLSGGVAALTLAACVYAIEVRGWRRWAHPFVVLGRNAITLFVVSGLIGKVLIVFDMQGAIFDRGFAWMAPPKMASLLYALAFLALMYALCEALYRRRVFLSA